MLTEQQLADLADIIEVSLPPNTGFMILVSPMRPHGSPDSECRAQYVSNVNRKDAVKVLKTALFRWGINEEWMKEAK